MQELYETIQNAAKAVEEAVGRADIAVILGSGLGGYGDGAANARTIAYADIPGFPRTTVLGHAGKLTTADCFGKRVLLMSGRFHSYEGHELSVVTLPVRVMALLGVKTLLITNAAGAINRDFHAGELTVLTDYINMTGQNPLRGANLDAFGPRFPDMTSAYDKQLRQLALSCAQKLGITARQGVYAWMPGPSYESPAEINMLRVLGADVVGMSTVPETIVARHCGMRVLGISCVTNMAAGVLDRPLCHEEVIETGKRVAGDFKRLTDEIIKSL